MSDKRRQTPVSEDGPAPVEESVVGNDALGRLARYWYGLAAAEGGVPRRDTLDPAKIVDLLPHLILVEHLGDGEFRYRLMGTEVDRFTKARYTGRRTSEIDGHGPGNRIHALYSATLVSDRPIGMALPYVGRSSFCSSVRQIAVPFRTGAVPDQILSLIHFELRDGIVPAMLGPQQRRLL